MNPVYSELIDHFSGPVLTNYVWWILQETINHGCNTIYFLARDGYLLREIALKFCRKFHLNIECRYLYCSRTALRMPSYHLIGEEANDLLLVRTQHATLASILSRAELTDQEIDAVRKEAGLEAIALKQELTGAELKAIEAALRASKLFQELVAQKSRDCYPSVIHYFQQEDLFDKDNIVIADSGWTGSMQRSIRQLLQSAGYQGTITGLYFGMFRPPKAPEDGTYLTWYFHSQSPFADRVRFNNNLFECLLSAPHGMTVGYREENGVYLPIQANPPSKAEADRTLAHIHAVLEFTDRYLEHIAFDRFDSKKLHRDTRKRICRYMVTPTQQEAEYYGSLLFCDDVTEGYQITLADASQRKLLDQYLVLRRLWLKLTGQNQNMRTQGLYWPYGTMAFLPWFKRIWYRWNFYLWERMNHIRYSKY